MVVVGVTGGCRDTFWDATKCNRQGEERGTRDEGREDKFTEIIIHAREEVEVTGVEGYERRRTAN